MPAATNSQQAALTIPISLALASADGPRPLLARPSRPLRLAVDGVMLVMWIAAAAVGKTACTACAVPGGLIALEVFVA